ncbi:histidine ammonia-lyase [Acidipila rosea]|uniref:Histidine ammonia-lyase n=1 Tax=Acidipila rosea TaxID=768535 RepID=A0A4V6NEU2_9BACT|nr:histidine ammonia-lyase [Acidipila rosea]TCK73991.1 histidine ammonia-lyase [Acidipila rosea]
MLLRPKNRGIHLYLFSPPDYALVMIVLDGQSLTVDDVVAVANRAEQVRISEQAMAAMSASRDYVEAAMCGSAPVYALNTGVGLLANIRLAEPEIDQMQVNLVRSHCCGVGEPLPSNVVRGMMLIRANVLAKGFSGIRPVVAERICDLLNHGITPIIPSRGSVGASGDLAPLAHMALVLIGEGFAEYRGEVLPGDRCLQRAGLQPLQLRGKEGISLLNGTQAMLSIGCLQLEEMEGLFYSAQTTAALTMEALRGTPAAYDPRLHAARPHPGQVRSAQHLLDLLKGSTIPRTQGEGGDRIQDAYCLRCVPQVHGAFWDTLTEARRVFAIELNSATDNPLVFLGDDANPAGAILSGGNFHGAPLALALDYLAIALCQLAGISERRTERLLNPALNQKLPAFLASQPGLESGLMMAQVTAAALVAELRVLASPASTGSIPTSGNQEDFVSMGMTSALKLQQGLKLARMVIAIELLAAARALDLRQDTSTPALEEAKALFRRQAPAWREDCVLSVAMEKADRFLAGDPFRHIVHLEHAEACQ